MSTGAFQVLKKVFIVLILGLFIVKLVCSKTHSETLLTKEYYVEVTNVTDDNKLSTLSLTASRYGLKYMKRVSRNVHIFSEEIIEDQAGIHHGSQIRNFSAFFHEEIKTVQEVRKNRVRNSRPHMVFNGMSHAERFKREASLLMTCDPYYGMDVEEAWSLGFTGDGVNIGIIDVGVDVSLPDIAQNVNASIGFNFVRKGDSLLPDYDNNYPEADDLLDHGNNIAGLVAAIKGNKLCSAGVAYNASIVPLVVFKLDKVMNWFLPDFDDTFVPDALAHLNQQIHIYTNSYNSKDPFVKPSLPLVDNLKIGTTEGRQGKGSIFVFSLGDNKNGLWDGNMDYFANSIQSITVGSVGKNGEVPGYSIPCACIIASTLSDGNTMDSDSFLTTSHSVQCKDDFRGSSAAAGIGAGIIALVLQHRLSWRDVQYILILTSSLDDLKPRLPTVINARGLKFNPHFGYGMMNATAFALAARSWTLVPPQSFGVFHTSKRTRLTSKLKSTEPGVYMVLKVTVDECQAAPLCVRYVEHIVARVDYTATRDKLVSFRLYSPALTESVLLHDARDTLRKLKGQKKKTLIRRDWEFTSVQFWGESPIGDWTLVMTQYDKKSNKSYTDFTVHDFTLSIYGTHENPYKENADLFPITHVQDKEETSDALPTLFDPEENERLFDEIIEIHSEILEDSPNKTSKGNIFYYTLTPVIVFLVIFLIAVCKCHYNKRRREREEALRRN